MAAYTSTSTGNWNNSSTWGGSGIPGSGDTATIASPNVVTIPDGYTATVGTTSGTTGTVALTVNSGGKLVIGSQSTYAGASLALQGDCQANGTAECFTMYGGAALIFNPASGQVVKLLFNTGNVGCKGSINGLSNARCAVYTAAGAFNSTSYGCITYTSGSTVCIYKATYTDFANLGGGSQVGITTNIGTSGTPDVTFTDCTFGAVNTFYLVANNNATSNINISNCNFGYTYSGTSSPCTSAGNGVVYALVNEVQDGGIARNFTNNYVYGNAKFTTVQGWTFDGTIFAANGASGPAQLNSGGAGQAWVSANGCLFVGNTTPTNSYLIGYGYLTDCYLSSLAGGYPHYIQQPSTAYYVDGGLVNCVLDGSLNPMSVDGEGTITQDPNSASTWTITGCISTPDRQGTGACGLVLCNYVGTEAAAGDVSVTLLHNTCYLSGKAMFTGPETGDGYAGALAQLEANIVWSYAAGSTGPTLVLDDNHAASGTGIVQNVGAPGNLNYNCSYNLCMSIPTRTWYTNQGNGYCADYSATPGANDLVNVNPQLVDPARNMGKWWRSIPGNVTGGSDQADATSALGQLALVNTSAYNSTYTVAALLSYVRAGNRPQNSALMAASYPGDTSASDAAGNAWPGGAPGIGAMAYQSTFMPWIFGDQIESNGGG